MPEILAPGIFVQETSFAGQPIEGVSTSIAAFIGLTERGPFGAVSPIFSSYAEFEREYGGDNDLIVDGHSFTNYIAHAVRKFIDNGGDQLLVVRVSPPLTQTKSTVRPISNIIRGFFDRFARSRFGTRKAPTATYRDALRRLEGASQVSIIAAPSAAHALSDTAEAAAHLRSVHAEMIVHADRMQHRIAVLDPPPSQSPQEVATFASTLDSSHAALYYPWLQDAATELRILILPPSGAICGIYARTDRQRGVWKAPANATINGISGFERDIHTAEQEALNPIGVNVSRKISGRGMRLWGARTLSSDPEWRYVSVRRYLSFLKKSISDGLDWTVFEPNGEPLWAECKNHIDVFLIENWRQGALRGQTASDAFFVRCDRTTMTQSDIDNGRLIAEIGVAVLKPAEFQIFKISKNLSDAI